MYLINIKRETAAPPTDRYGPRGSVDIAIYEYNPPFWGYSRPPSFFFRFRPPAASTYRINLKRATAATPAGRYGRFAQMETTGSERRTIQHWSVFKLGE